jgi:hypothetical protein
VTDPPRPLAQTTRPSASDDSSPDSAARRRRTIPSDRARRAADALADPLRRSAPENGQPSTSGTRPLDVLGRRLGFETEGHGIAGAAVWSSPTGVFLVVAVVEAADAVERIGQAGHVRDAAAASIRSRARDDLTLLYVTRGIRDQAALERVLLVRQAWPYLRLITWEALARLAALVETRALTHGGALTLLLPARAYADSLVALVAAPHERGRRDTPGEGVVPVPLSCSTCGGGMILLRAGPRLTWCRCAACGALWSVVTALDEAAPSGPSEEEPAMQRRQGGDPPRPCSVCGSTLAWAAIYAGELVYLQCRECDHLWPIKDRRMSPERRVPR